MSRDGKKFVFCSKCKFSWFLPNHEIVNILTQRIDNFKKALVTPTDFTYALFTSNSPKKDYIRAWGEALEDIYRLEGREDDIQTISSTIRNDLKTLGATEAIDWAKKVLPYKYKNSSMIHASTLLHDEMKNWGTESPDNLNRDYERENDRAIQWLQANIDLMNALIEKMKKSEFLTRVDPFEFDEMVTRSTGMMMLLKEVKDYRDDVLPQQIHLFFAAFEATKNYTFSKYLKLRSDIGDLSGKQAMRLLSGRVTNVETLYDPQSRRDARRAGFVGMPCPECGSWRMDIKYNQDAPGRSRDMFWCYACKKWSEPKTEKLVSKII